MVFDEAAILGNTGNKSTTYRRWRLIAAMLS